MTEYFQGWKIEVLENDYLRVAVIPELGAKIVQLFDKKANFEWLWSDPSRPLRTRNGGDSYDEHDISGFDECFPNIGKGNYPQNLDIKLPDHGELWTENWTSEKSKSTLVNSVSGKVLPYKFERTLNLNRSSLEISYTIENVGQDSFFGIWAAHPLFNAVEGMSIEINGNPRMRKEFSFSGRIGNDGADGYEGHLEEYNWPFTYDRLNNPWDISKITLGQLLTDKVTLNSPKDGVVALLNPRNKCSIRFIFNPDKIPFVGLCFNFGAWPFTGKKVTWVAVEPTLGPTDRLDECHTLGLAPIFQVGKVHQFSFEMSFGG